MSELIDNLATPGSEEKSFFELLKENKVSIPKIQRDYAQGRKTKNIQYIREMFLNNLFKVLSDNHYNKKLKLDFVYGYEDKDKLQDKEITIFKPLDGQQRLTTLFLLHWYFAKKESVSEDELSFLKNFSYDTRKSSRDFCEKLVDFQPDFSQEVSEKTTDRIEKQIINQNWFIANWKNDPTITSMLVMLKAIDEKFNGLSNIWGKLTGNNPSIVFHLLKMKNLGLPDDLYIKMNARGKPLTDFEHFKSQFLEVLSGEFKETFNSKIDREWADLFWDIFKENQNPDSDIAQNMDKGFLSFLWFITDILITNKGIERKDKDFWLETIKKVYLDKENVKFLFNSLNFFEKLNELGYPKFEEVFYINQEDFTEDKVRLFFNNPTINLFKKCVEKYRFGDEKSTFSLGEQILLYTYIKSYIEYGTLDKVKLRKIRNLTSDTELRNEYFKLYLQDVDLILEKDELSSQSRFSRRQFDEDKQKSAFIEKTPVSNSVLYQLEDHNLLRGSTGIFDIDEHLPVLAEKFLESFPEKQNDYESISSVLLTFGDYTQAYGGSRKKRFGNNNSNTWREIFTQSTQRSSKDFSRTKKILKDYLTLFIENPKTTNSDVINTYLAMFNDNEVLPKDLNYYLVKYPTFHKWKNSWTDGFYYWDEYENKPYDCWMLFRNQFNGRHWSPFLLTVNEDLQSCSIENYGSDLSFNHDNIFISISHDNDGFIFKGDESSQYLINKLIEENTLSQDGKLLIAKNDEGIDLEDRIVKLKTVLENLTLKS